MKTTNLKEQDLDDIEDCTFMMVDEGIFIGKNSPVYKEVISIFKTIFEGVNEND